MPDISLSSASSACTELAEADSAAKEVERSHGENHNLSTEQRLGRLMIDETRSCYVSHVLWANLGNEIEELRDMLYDAASEDEDYEIAHGQQTPFSETTDLYGGHKKHLGANAALLGFHSLAHTLLPFHPPLQQSVALLNIFKANVVPLVRIFHLPSTIQTYWDAIASPQSVDKTTEALLFAIYYSSVISMPVSGKDQCERILGISRQAAVNRYRFAIEQALARSDLLNTQSMVLLQAAVLFLWALRSEDDSRTAWTLTATVFHIAQAMGLHRDGEHFGLRPLDIELRRRLWWHIAFLDLRSSEYHGCEPIMRESCFDTKFPLNINDSDISAGMTQPPTTRQGVTETTFTLIRCETIRASWKVSYMPTSRNGDEQESSTMDTKSGTDSSLNRAKEAMHTLEERIHEKYLQHCDLSVPFQFMCFTVARLILARLWLLVHYPSGRKIREGDVDDTLRHQLFLRSMEVLNHSKFLLSHPDIAPWTWHSKTHIQWHAMALVLSEICVRPSSSDCDRGWESVNAVLQEWEAEGKEKKGALWRPIMRLVAKARYVREIQRTDRRGKRRQDISPPYSSTDHYCSLELPRSAPTSSGPASQPAAGENAHSTVNPTGLQHYKPLESWPNDPSAIDYNFLSIFALEPLDSELFSGPLREDRLVHDVFSPLLDHEQ